MEEDSSCRSSCHEVYINNCSGNPKAVSTQFRASPVERALSSALNRVMLKISFEN